MKSEKSAEKALKMADLTLPEDMEYSRTVYIIKFGQLLENRGTLSAKSLQLLEDLSFWARQKDTLISMAGLYPTWPGFYEQLEQAQRMTNELQAALGILPATGRALADTLAFDQRYVFYMSRTETHELAYLAVEEEYRQFFGKNRYSSFESFRRTYSRRLKAKRDSVTLSEPDDIG